MGERRKRQGPWRRGGGGETHREAGGGGGGERKAGKLGWERGGFKYFCTLAELSLAGFY